MLIRGVYVITDETLVPGRTHVEIAEAALRGGASVIQLRDKHAPDEYLIRTGREIRSLTSEVGALFIVNDRVEVALACDADGIHVGQSDCRASEIRERFVGRIVGVSVSTPEEAARARADGADYLGVGPIFATSTKPDAAPATGLEMIGKAREASAGLPVVAIGGINDRNIADVARAGADSAAVISAVVCAEDMTVATRRLVDEWNRMSQLRVR